MMTATALGNLLRTAIDRRDEESFSDILTRPGCRIERIVSFGQVTPEERPFVGDGDEWVLLLAGAARVSMNGEEASLEPGDHLLIPNGTRHWVTFTAPDVPTIWLAIHFQPPSEG